MSIQVDYPAIGLGRGFVTVTFDGLWPRRRCSRAGHEYPAPYFLTEVVREGDFHVLRATSECALCRGGRASAMPRDGKLKLRIGEMRDENGHPTTWIDSEGLPRLATETEFRRMGKTSHQIRTQPYKDRVGKATGGRVRQAV